MHSPLEIAKNYIIVCVNKAKIPVLKMVILGMMAGIFIAFAGVTSSVANALVNRFIGACVFPAGMAMVLLAGSELFTGNNLIILAVLDRQIKARQMFKNWVFVYLGNLIGAVLIAALTVFSGTFDAFPETIIGIARNKSVMSFGDAFVRGILCNILVCIAVWMSFASKKAEGKIMTIFFPIMAFVFCGFEHSIANMYYLPAGLFALLRYGIEGDGLTWMNALINNLLPVTLGNIVGGTGVGFAYWFIYLHATKNLSRKEEEEELGYAEEY